ncbi:MAG: hypothetical protein AAB590_00290 [Patescibacteria group bacterium]
MPVILLSVFILPWWVTAILILVGSFLFKIFIEGVLISILIQLFYGRDSGPIYLNAILLAIIAITLIEFVLKPRLRL